MRVVVVGCGIGGATASLALEAVGIDHVVLEQAEALTEVGAGLQLSPNAVRVLERVGLGPALAEIGVSPQAHVFRDGLTGDTLLRTPLMPGIEAHFGAPYYHAHRAELLGIMTDRMGDGRVRLGARVRAISHDPGGVQVELDDGTVEEGDVLVGADGVHSVVREQLFDPSPPRDAGCVAWRGLVDPALARSLGFEENAYAYMGPHRCAVLYFVAGGRWFNWVGIGPYDQAADESWSQTGSNEVALQGYEGWQPEIRTIIRATENLFVTSMLDRDPLPRWVSGPVALLGDAAHAMLPYHAQGAAQSIEDAWVLSRCLERHADEPAAGLVAYEGLRRERANTVLTQSRQFRQTWELSDPAEIEARNARFARHQDRLGERFPPAQEWLYGYDAEAAVLGTDDEWRALSW